jgi:hypothetical protein
MKWLGWVVILALLCVAGGWIAAFVLAFFMAAIPTDTDSLLMRSLARFDAWRRNRRYLRARRELLRPKGVTV